MKPQAVHADDGAGGAAAKVTSIGEAALAEARQAEDEGTAALALLRRLRSEDVDVQHLPVRVEELAELLVAAAGRHTADDKLSSSGPAARSRASAVADGVPPCHHVTGPSRELSSNLPRTRPAS